jgi:hypothetical protein
MSLLNLAQAFDQTPAANLPARVALAEQMRPLLGAQYDAFDAAYEALCASAPEHPAPAVAIVGSMYEEHREAARAFVRLATDQALCLPNPPREVEP